MEKGVSLDGAGKGKMVVSCLSTSSNPCVKEDATFSIVGLLLL